MQAVREDKEIQEGKDPNRSQVGGFYQEDNRPNYQNLIQAQVDGSQRMAKSNLAPSRQSVIQRKRKRKADDESATQDKGVSVQRIVKEGDIGKKIIIDDPRASDFGDTGRLIRKSRNVHGCLVVEFDNEPGVQYRVWPREMSALGELNAEEEEDIVRYVSKALHGPSGLILTATIDWTQRAQTAVYHAYYQGRLAGQLDIAVYGNKVFILDVHTFEVVPGLQGASRVPGLGTVFLELAADMARKFNINQLSLSATKKETDHPGPFYHRFGFDSGVDLEDWGGNLATYLRTHGNKTINMDATPGSVSAKTQPYITSKNWAFGNWSRL